MEPAAPGTEDDVLIVPGNFMKKENEQSRLLSVKAKLPNGVYSNVFEHSIVNGSDHWYCNLCVCPIMGRIYHHEVGKRHCTNMQAAGGITAPPELDTDADPEPSMLVAPGEPVPPGFEENIEKVAQVQERLDAFTVDPLIGLEYLFELIEYDLEKEPSYLCTLCDKRGDPRTVIAHLASYNHILQYLQRHFLKCYRALAPYITKQYKRNWHTAMQKIAEAIETKYGRLKPHVVDKDVFEKNRVAYNTMVSRGPHFQERVGATFEELVVKEDLTKVFEDDAVIVKQAEESVKRNYRKRGMEDSDNTKRSPSPPIVAKPKKPRAAPIEKGEKRRSLSSVSSISSNDLSDFEPGEQTVLKKNNKPNETLNDNLNKKMPPLKPYNSSGYEDKRFGPKRNYRQSPHRSNSRERYDKSGRSLPPWQRPDYRSREDNPIADRPKPKFDKNSEFKKLATAIEKDMERILKQHEKHPEKHPQYNDEWKTFWNQRYKQLQAEGKNPAGHDFKPEWIDYWNKRLKELHEIEVKVKKDALRKRLGLPEEPAPICFRITGKKKPNKDDDSKLAPMASTPDHDPDVIIIDDKDTEEKTLKRSHSPWESESGRLSHQSRSIGRRSHSTGRRSRSKGQRSCSRDRRSRSRDRRSRSRDRRLERSRSRGRRSHSRGRRSHSRDRHIEWTNRDPYRDYHERSHEHMYYHEYAGYIKPPKVMRDVTRHPVTSPKPELRPEIVPEPEDDGDINLVSVLRLLTALEEKLGSLGPKVIDLLSQALAMEKAEANSSETLLDNDINCVMFETVKEKLKGQLLAGLVSSAQEKAFKIAIKKMASLIYLAGERKKEKEREKPKIDPIKVAGVGTVDKAAIAKQIAAALIVQGKTDVTQAELEQLINAVVGIAEASQTSNKPMTTASFLQQLTQQKDPEPVKKEEPSMAALKTVCQSTAEPISLTSTTSMEGLSDSDLQTLLQNFKDLCTDEQHSLISYLKKLEAREPERVERLRKFVNLEVPSVISERDNDALFEKSDDETNGKISPFANRFAGTNPTSEDTSRNKTENSDKPKVIAKVTIDSDEEDYTFEDVFAAANKNVRDKEEKEEQERLLAKSVILFKNEDFDLSNTKSLIANIMDQVRSKTDASPVEHPVNPIVAPPAPPKQTSVPIPTNFADPSFLNNINIANLTDALNNAQQIKSSKSEIQPPISNPNSFSLKSNPVQANLNPNNFSLQPQKNQIQGNQPRFGGSNNQVEHHNPQLDQRNPLYDPPSRNSQIEPRNASFEPRKPLFEKIEHHLPSLQARNQLDQYNLMFEPKNPQFKQHNNQLGHGNFKIEPRNPDVGPHNPQFQKHNPQFEQHSRQFEQRDPQFGSHNSQFRPHNPQFGLRNPQFEPHGSRISVHNNTPSFEPRNLQFENRNPLFDSRNSQYDPSQQNQHFPPHPANNLHQGHFNRQSYPNQSAQRPEYLDDYDNRW